MKKTIVLTLLIIFMIFNTNEIYPYISDFERKDDMFQVVLNIHTVTFLDYFDNPISTITVLNNKSVENDIPKIADDVYVFDGWDTDFHNVTMPLWVQAIYNKEKTVNKVNTRIVNNDKNVNLDDEPVPSDCAVFFAIPSELGYSWVEMQEVEYGKDAIEPDSTKIPRKIIHQYVYENIPSNITSDLTIKPTRKVVLNY